MNTNKIAIFFPLYFIENYSQTSPLTVIFVLFAHEHICKDMK